MKQKLLTTILAAACITSVSYAQTRQVSGKVTSPEGAPIAGASVSVIGGNVATQTDGSGNFTINVPQGARLSVSYVGFTSQTVLIGNSSVINVVLSDANNVLDEIVVTGAGLTASRRSIGAAQTTIKAEDLQQARPTNIVTGLTGKVAGLTVQGVGSGVNPNYRVMLRGMRSLTGNNQALVVIDNVISPSSMLGNLNPDDVEDITVAKWLFSCCTLRFSSI
ncbi:carboxypeptidase-like protein [Sphingobacterium alimentarium]|uniref:Carboxypeptidase-like protein n=1 Tax=Sphingobacterium alimentarium TaxID=797292 RepID=A0A4R3VWF2_9SPHI|nr:carboxypeptidase-like regulatory domain-containing protein [Sphingobacterium alimentarium]TCV10903.1 carboxypeptidase-like protein [Sphingobacterium alimentarium]